MCFLRREGSSLILLFTEIQHSKPGYYVLIHHLYHNYVPVDHTGKIVRFWFKHLFAAHGAAGLALVLPPKNAVRMKPVPTRGFI